MLLACLVTTLPTVSPTWAGQSWGKGEWLLAFGGILAIDLTLGEAKATASLLVGGEKRRLRGGSTFCSPGGGAVSLAAGHLLGGNWVKR